MKPEDRKRIPRWYFGGFASVGATMITHPLDLLKVHLQINQGEKMGVIGQTVKVIKNDGVLSLYNGLSASIMRQMTYSMARFGLYEFGKEFFIDEYGKDNINFLQKIFLAGTTGALGGFIGTPSDMVNVRMQNDMKLPVDKRYNYKHAIDGFIRVYKEKGPTKLFKGWEIASVRASLMTIGQLAFYDEIKKIMLKIPLFKDSPPTHFIASILAAAIATCITQPLDVIKTRVMSDSSGQNFLQILKMTAQLGPSAFYKGFVPAFIRLGPQTIFTFIFFEQLRQHFGLLPSQLNSPKS